MDEQLEQEDVKIEEAKDKANEDWAERMEREEMEAELRAQAAKPPEEADPTKDPENMKWMEEQLRINKQIHGDTFGEDIDESFE